MVQLTVREPVIYTLAFLYMDKVTLWVVTDDIVALGLGVREGHRLHFCNDNETELE